MRTWTVINGIALSLCLWCVSNTAIGQSNPSRLRVANFIERSPVEGIDIYLDDESTPIATNLRFAEASRALPISVGEHRVRVVATGGTPQQALFDESFITTSDSSYVVYAARTPGDTLRGIVMARWLSEPYPERTVLIYMLHLAPRLGKAHIDFKNWGGDGSAQTYTFASRASGEWRRYPVPEGKIETDIDPTKIKEFNKFSTQYLGGPILTFIVTGAATDTSLAVYELAELDTTEQRPVKKQRRRGEEDGAVRFVILTPDILNRTQEEAAPNFGGGAGASTAPNVSGVFREAMQVSDDFLGLLRVRSRIYEGIPTRELQRLDDTIMVNKDTLYTYYLVGTAKDSSATQVILHSSLTARPSAGKSWVRLLHAGADLGRVDVELRYADGSIRQILDLEYQAWVDYEESTAGVIEVRVSRAGSNQQLLWSSGRIDEDSVYTLIISGIVKNSSMGINRLSDLDMNAQLPIPLFTATVGIKEQQEQTSSMKIFPNPSRDEFAVGYVSSGRGEDRIEVVDLFGRVVLRREVGAGIVGERLVGIRTEGLSSGSYRVRVIDGAGMEVGSGGVMVVK
ncbi:MAG: DUF4397 domain-containing protein [Chlorobi bacterium]|nr:MAG: hypothetical protein UZ07_CHB004001711 [Chlorobi bacterium OLB7]MBK8912711.1 DUF4397 domain-containing protein [Chlorobiota bacterium]MBX7216453.1 hypothetical protein [Candidatus Kapabacteria bacterium]